MLTGFGFRAVWNDAKQEVGLGDDDQVVPHILRHTCASRLVQGGIDIRRVQMWLGHQTLQMTMRYAHLATNDLDFCLRVLDRHGPPSFEGQPSRDREGPFVSGSASKTEPATTSVHAPDKRASCARR
jgi:hypothetical protein